MNRVTITLTIDLPEGVVPDVQYADTPPEPQDLFVPPPPEYDADAIVPQLVAKQPPFCPVHGREMKYFPAGPIKSGPRTGQQRAAFYKCTAKDGERWCDQRKEAA
jgi:hypothetical protein